MTNENQNENPAEDTVSVEAEDIVEAQTDETAEDTAEPTADDRIAELEAEVNKLKDAYVRAHAEMENVRKRAAADMENRTKFAVQNFAKDILTVADNLQRALDVLPKDENNMDETTKNLSVGLNMTVSDLETTLERHKVIAAPGVGAPFDPHVHQAVQEVSDPNVPAGTVVQVFQTGYVLNGRLLREAMVVVSKDGPKGDGQQPGGPGASIDTEA